MLAHRTPRTFKFNPRRRIIKLGFFFCLILSLLAEGDKVAARCTVRGHHQGDSLGFAATQKPMEITGTSIVRIENGQIVEAWNNFDFMSMFQQLGAI